MKYETIKCPACGLQWADKRASIADYKLLVCSNCGLWFCNPNDLIDIDYDEVYKTVEYQDEYFDSLSKINDWTKLTEFPTFKQFFTLNKPAHEAKKLLDVGCGVGRFCRAAHSVGWDVKGIDISKTAIEKGKENVPFTMLSCTVEELVDKEEIFDIATAFEVLEHLIAPLELLTSVRNIIKPNGKFFCTVPNVESLTVRNSSRNDWIPPVHVLFFTQQALQELLVRAGFKDVTTGVTWVNKTPSGLGPKLVKFYLNKMFRKNFIPDPLGLWATGTK